ncbi:MAG: 50S ribosomal protein L23 [Calditrichaeota bacterium]|nr:MAG: 50S ribosomal protein L23 [Calditrichota bacterium]
MKAIETVIRHPLLTEKMLIAQEKLNQYGFMVDRNANKIDIKAAIEAKFDVRVENVCTMFVKGKSKRMNTKRGLTTGKRASWKKAIVTLNKDDKIDFFQGIA